MWSEYSLDVVDAVARHGSFSAAAQELHRVPSAISYTVRQIEEWLAVPLFVRRHRDVELTPAGKLFVDEARGVMKKMLGTRRLCQQVANGWSGQLKVAVDSIVKQQRCRQLVLDFYRQFPEVELLLDYEVYNGVWDALADDRTDIVIGATSAVPVASQFTFRDMGLLNWLCVVSSRHPLAAAEGLLSDDQLRPFASLCMTDTSRNLPKRDTWTLDNQRRLVVPHWASAIDCLRDGLCVGMAPAHLAATVDRARRAERPATVPALPSQPVVRGVGAEQTVAGHGLVARLSGGHRNPESGVVERGAGGLRLPRLINPITGKAPARSFPLPCRQWSTAAAGE